MDIFDKAKRSEIMSRVRSSDTTPELKVRSVLHALGYRFRLHRRDLPGTPDIVLPSRSSIIFVHGCFWHRHKGCPDATTPSTRGLFWERKFSENTARDKRNVLALRKLGWKILIVWECELRDEKTLIKKLKRFLDRRSCHPS